MADVVPFGKWLKEQRSARRLTQEDLAERIGCSIWTVQKIETGERRPSTQVAELIADFFGVPVGERRELIRLARKGEQAVTDEPDPWSSSMPESGEFAGSEATTQSIGQAAHNLPAPLTPLTGREQALARLVDILLRSGTRLVTLTGSPGVGKTRLGIDAARRMANRLQDGAYFVPLAPISDPALVATVIAGTLDLKEKSDLPLLDVLVETVRDKQLLLLLDNFEQVLSAGAQVARLLEACPGLKVLVTSREPLNITGERQLAVAPLALPEEDTGDPQTLAIVPAVAFFADRARAALPSFVLTQDNAGAVARLCIRLDGLPLAIELAAARVKIFSPSQILSRLATSRELLAGGTRDLPDRHRTLRAAIDWSYNLLSAGEQVLLARLAVFPGGCTLAAVEAVCNTYGDLPFDALEGIASLCDKSLLRQEVDPAGDTRFSLLEMIREYALDRLEGSGAAEMLRRLHAEHYLAMAELAEPDLAGLRQHEIMDALDSEHTNMRAALSWALQCGEIEIALLLAGALGEFWYTRGYLSEGLRWLEAALACGAGSDAATAKALGEAGALAYRQGEHARAGRFYDEALSFYRSLSDTRGSALVLNRLGIMAFDDDNFSLAHRYFTESLELWRELEDTWGIALSLNSLGDLAYREADWEGAELLWHESLAMARKLGDKRIAARVLYNLAGPAMQRNDYHTAELLLRKSLDLSSQIGNKDGMAQALNMLGWTTLSRGEFSRSRDFFGSSLALCREVGIKRGVGATLKGIAYVALHENNPEEARTLLEESLSLFRDLDDKTNAIESLEGLAAAAGAEGNPLLGARLMGAAEAWRDAVGYPVSEVNRHIWGLIKELAGCGLGTNEYQEAHSEGKAITAGQAMRAALGEAPPTSN